VTDHSLPPEREHGGSGHVMANCAQVREEAAVALLAHSEPAPAVLAHLGACPPCWDEYLELAALPPMLDAARQVAGGTAAPTGPPSVHLLDRLLSEVTRRRRRRHLVTALATAAAVVAIAVPAARLIDRDVDGSGTVPRPGPLIAAGSSSSSGTSPGSSMGGGASGSFAGSGVDPASGARADVAIAPMGSASAVTVWVHGVPVGDPCRMVVHDDAGRSLEAGTWVVDAPSGESYIERVEVAPSSIERVELLDARTGRRILDVPIHQV
jgi:hypothetical protein